jgi:aryl-alcohol dehydrogenase-like predicted oxidoreductase
LRYKRLGKSDLNISVVGLGTWAMGNDAWGAVEDSASIETIRAAIDSGVNLIDTAPAYGAGHAEEIVGRAIRGLRGKVIIATKCGVLRDGKKYSRCLKPESIRKEIDDSLRRLGVDVIDLYQIHWPDVNTPLEDTIEELIKIKASGKFRHLGVSNFNNEQMLKVMERMELVSLQPQYSLLSRENESYIDFCKENNIGVLSYGSLGAGLLSGKFKERPTFEDGDNRGNFYPFFKEPLWSKSVQLLDVLKAIAQKHEKPVSHVAVNWVTQNDRITTALVGAKTPAQARENAESASWELTECEIKEINTAYEKIMSQAAE